MRGTGAEQLVVGRKVLSWDWTEGAAGFRRGSEPTGNGRSSVATAKPFSIPKRECANPSMAGALVQDCGRH